MPRTRTKPEDPSTPVSGTSAERRRTTGTSGRFAVAVRPSGALEPARGGGERGAGAFDVGPARVATHELSGPSTRVWVGDCREVIPRMGVEPGTVDLIFADPPFNWNRAYDRWHDAMPREDYIEFTRHWLDLCRWVLRPGGALWVNIPDDTAAEIVVHLKGPGRGGLPALTMENWCIWHYRFGQNTRSRFINSKVHALYFTKPGGERTWNVGEILEPSDRATTYFDPRTQSKKDGMPPGMRVPMDVWYGKYWGRIQGNNKERRAYHDNQLPEVYLERVIRACSNPGELVMDPFVGSGTTGVMARHLGRRFVGVEYSPENAKSAMERIKSGPVARDPANEGSAIFEPRRRRTGKGGASEGKAAGERERGEKA